MSVTRTIALDDLTPDELASIWAHWDNEKQAEFLSAAWREGATWPGAGWCQQACSIVEKVDDDGGKLIDAIAGHYALKTGWRPEAADDLTDSVQDYLEIVDTVFTGEDSRLDPIRARMRAAIAKPEGRS